MTCSFMTNI